MTHAVDLTDLSAESRVWPAPGGAPRRPEPWARRRSGR